MTFEELKALDDAYIMHTYGRFPVDIDHGEGATLYSLSGRKYIDFTSGIGVNSLGYGNEKWMAAITAQIGKLGHISNLFYTQPGPLLARELCTRSGLSKVFFGNSGAEANEAMITERGSMVWMSPNMKMETGAGGIGKAFGRMFSGESMFQNTYTAQGGAGMIAFASSFPGSIKAVEIDPAHPVVVQKSGFLASEQGVELSIFFQKKAGAGFFGGEGFIMQKLSGRGTAFLEVDGYAVEYELQAGQSMVVDSGNLAMMDATCTIDIQMVKGVKNVLFGGEGLFNTVVTGPGKILLQTMPVSGVAAALAPFFNTGSK